MHEIETIEASDPILFTTKLATGQIGKISGGEQFA